MEYVSTRGRAPGVGFKTALLSGSAPDGGLYMPSVWPEIDAGEIDSATFADASARILSAYAAPWIETGDLREMAERAYAGFDAGEVAPLRRIGEDDWILELFHGPTLAFKDVAMQILGPLMRRALAENGERATILGATSGDTGSAAIEAFRGADCASVFILHPAGRVSDVQRLMMTTVVDENVCNIAIEGTFDDCQRLVKALFADAGFARRHRLCGVNSINWARLAAQTVYYFTAVAGLKRVGEARAPSFVVPTGNFGDAFAGYAAKAMGLECGRICVAVNENDILHRAFAEGVYRPRPVIATFSPSMDIAVAGNFERLLFEASGRHGAAVEQLMRDLEETGSFNIPAAWLESMRENFVSQRASDREGAAEMETIAREQGMLIDPHTAVGLAALRKARAEGAISGPAITLATAHPAKFPKAVEAATGRKPALPERFAELAGKPEIFIAAPATLGAVRRIIDERAPRRG